MKPEQESLRAASCIPSYSLRSVIAHEGFRVHSALSRFRQEERDARPRCLRLPAYREDPRFRIAREIVSRIRETARKTAGPLRSSVRLARDESGDLIRSTVHFRGHCCVPGSISRHGEPPFTGRNETKRDPVKFPGVRAVTSRARALEIRIARLEDGDAATRRREGGLLIMHRRLTDYSGLFELACVRSGGLFNYFCGGIKTLPGAPACP